MKQYVGAISVTAEPELRGGCSGYLIQHPDGHEEWMPEHEFDSKYFEVGDRNTITPEAVMRFIVETETVTIGDKTTVVRAELANGFVIVESSSCADPANYSKDKGENICMEHIKSRVWRHLSFLLQLATRAPNQRR